MLVNGLIISLISLYISTGKVFSSSLSLTSVPDVRAQFTVCPGRIVFTCRGTNSQDLKWVLANSYEIYPLNNMTFESTLPIQKEVTSLQDNQDGTINITTTLSGNASFFGDDMKTVQCVDMYGASVILLVQHVGAPPSPSGSTSCFVSFNGNYEVVIQWSPSFTSKYNVTMYRVLVSPTNPTCLSTRMIRPSAFYVCNGLVLGIRYSFTISAINCMSLEGTRHNFTVQTRVPDRARDIIVTYIRDQNRHSHQLEVQWRSQLTIISDECSFDSQLNNRVVLEEESTGRILNQGVVRSDNCEDNVCSMIFTLSSLNSSQVYVVGIEIITAHHGSSVSQTRVSVPPYEISSSSDTCGFSTICSFDDIGECFIEYGLDRSYQNLYRSRFTPLNSPLLTHVIETSTRLYYRATIHSSSISPLLLQVRGNVISGKGISSIASSIDCSLVRTTGGPEVSIQWSPSFTSIHNVEMYHVVVSPTTPSCPSSQMITPSEEYNCSRLRLGTVYSFSISAMRCRVQEGPRYSFKVLTQAPESPDGIVLIYYNNNGYLNELKVQWMQNVLVPCFTTVYTVILEDSTGRRLDHRVVDSTSCSDDACSTTFSLSFFLYLSFHLIIDVTNPFGSSRLDSDIIYLPSSNDTRTSCVAFILCSFRNKKNCFLQYSSNNSYEDLGPLILTPDNTFIVLPITMATTHFYYQVSVNNTHTNYSSIHRYFRGNFTTIGIPLANLHYGLVVVGALLLCVAIIGLVTIIPTVYKKVASYPALFFLMIGSFTIFLSVVLWVAVVGLQTDNICDPTWQRNRDSLIISAHILSDISFLVVVLAIFLHHKCPSKFIMIKKDELPRWFIYEPETRINKPARTTLAAEELKAVACFHDISSRMAMKVLKTYKKIDGYYLLRPSNKIRAFCTICVTNKSKLVNHHLFKDEDKGVCSYYIYKKLSFSSIASLIAHYQTKPINKTLNTLLHYPVLSLPCHVSKDNELLLNK